MRPRPAGSPSDEALVPLGARFEVAGHPQMLFHHGFVEFQSKARGIRNRDVALVEYGLLHAGDQFLPPGDEIYRMEFHRHVGIKRGSCMRGGDSGQRRTRHVNGRGDALPRVGVIGNPFGLAAPSGSTGVRLDHIDGPIVDQRLEAFLQAEAVLASEQRRAGMRHDFFEVFPAPEAGGAE